VDPTERFAAAVARPDPEVPLDEVALLVAAHAYPGLDVDAHLRRLDDLATRCPEPTLDGLRELLFGQLGFDGARAEYYDPRNSYLNDVLDRRRGLPILLSLLTMEVGRRVGVPLAGVGMPGHFLVRDRVDPEVFLDPFAGGVLLDRAGCEARYREVQGDRAPFDPAWLEPTPRRDIVARVLANLRVAHARDRRATALAWVLRLRVLLPGADPAQRHALAAVLARLGRVAEAAAELDRVAAESTDPGGAARARTAALRLRARLN
jgi:regulator of sirC expression with transglutaminase-like and TPR domain